MMEKLCIFCKSIDMSTAGCHGDYPDPATFYCKKGKWEMTSYNFPEEFRKQIMIAEQCDDLEIA